MPLVLFGLTGGLASGKSTVARRFLARGLPVLDADAIAREIVAPGSEGLREVARAFGPTVLGPEGGLDRAALARRVFADAAERRRLEAITHPRIAARSMHLAAELEAAGEPLACYEAALLVERGMADSFRPLVVVALPEEEQVRRALRRDDEDEASIRRRLAAQTPLAEKVAVADHVIDSSGDVAATERQADRVLLAICRGAGIDPRRYGL